jgi:WD40 repeat protein
MNDGRLVVCTEVGEIILCESDGLFMNYIPESPTDEAFKIEAVMPFSRGFIIAGNENGIGKFYAYEKSEDPRVAYRLISKEPYEVKMDLNVNMHSMNMQISSIALAHSEDYVYFTTRSNQIMKADIPLYDGAEQMPKFEFVHCNFHTSEITGLDVCIRKQLVVTCSKDRTVKIWNYAQKTLEISYPL